MQILITLIVGLIIGVIAKAIIPGRDPGGLFFTALLGIAGAFVARYLGVWSNWYGPSEPVGLIAAVIGSILILFVYRLLTRGSTRVA